MLGEVLATSDVPGGVVRPAGDATPEEPADEPNWTALPDGPRRVLAFMETKTVWHPKGR